MVWTSRTEDVTVLWYCAIMEMFGAYYVAVTPRVFHAGQAQCNTFNTSLEDTIAPRQECKWNATAMRRRKGLSLPCCRCDPQRGFSNGELIALPSECKVTEAT